MSEPPRNIDEQIRQAMQRGEFDNLPGKGKPLNLKENPHEDPGWRMAHRLLKDSGFTLPWIEKRRLIDADFETALEALRQSWEWRRRALSSSQSGLDLDGEWQRALDLFRERMIDLNKRIRDYNLEALSSQFQRRSIDIEREIEAITNSSD